MVAGVAIGAIGVLSGVIAGASVGTGVIVAVVGMMVAVAIGVIVGVGVTVASSFREQLLRNGVLPRRRRRRARRRGNDFICAILPGEERHYQRVMNERLFFASSLAARRGSRLLIHQPRFTSSSKRMRNPRITMVLSSINFSRRVAIARLINSLRP